MAVSPSLAEVASRYNVPVSLAQALIGNESGGNASAVNATSGATGLTQVMPTTAAGMYGISPEEAAVKLKDPAFALDAGFKYLSQQKQAFGTWKLALAAYNAGPNAVKEYHGVPPYEETQNYVRNILGRVSPGSLLTPQEQAPGSVVSPSPAPVATTQPQTWSDTTSALAGLQAIAQGKHPDPLAELKALAERPPAPVAQPKATPSPLRVEVKGPVTPKVKSAVALAESYLGTPYVWGGEKPGGFDCSGLLQYTWAQKGVSIPRTTYDQFKTGQSVPRSKLQPGDAVFFKGSDSKDGLPGHVGMYIGGGRFIEAPHTGAVVRISTLAGRSDYQGARRYA